MATRLIMMLMLLGAISACKKSDPVPANPSLSKGNIVYISAEGGFNHGNAELSLYDPLSKTVLNNRFKSANGRPLGDVLQSMTSAGAGTGVLYLVVNNSGKIELISDSSGKSFGSVPGFTSPRYMVRNESAAPSRNIWYVSDLYASGVWEVDMLQQKILRKIPVPGYTEQMSFAASGATSLNELFICGVKRNKVYVLNTNTDQLIDSIPTGREPQWICADRSGFLWVLCNYYARTEPAQLLRINAATHQVTHTLSFPDAQRNPRRLSINTSRDTLYFLDQGGIYRMSITDLALPSAPLIPAQGRNLYSLGLDPFRHELYVSDALDYQQAGIIYRYSLTSLTQTDSFRAGVIPGDFYFRK